MDAQKSEIVELPRGRGQPTKFRPDYCEAIVEHMADGASMASFAAQIGVSRRVLTEWAGTHPEFAEAVDRAKCRALAWWEKRAREVAEGKGGPGASTMCVFGLKNFGPDDWQDKTQLEHSGHLRHSALSHEQALAEAARRGISPALLEE